MTRAAVILVLLLGGCMSDKLQTYVHTPPPYPLAVCINVNAASVVAASREKLTTYPIIDMGTCPPDRNTYGGAISRLDNDPGIGPSGRDVFARDKMQFYPPEGVAIEDVPNIKYHTDCESIAHYDQTYRRIVDISDTQTFNIYCDALAKLLVSRGRGPHMVDNFTWPDSAGGKWVPFDVSLKFITELKRRVGDVQLIVNSTGCPGITDATQMHALVDAADGCMFEQWLHTKYVRPYPDRIDNAVAVFRHGCAAGKLMICIPAVPAAEQEQEASMAAAFALMCRTKLSDRICAAYWLDRPIPRWMHWPKVLGEPKGEYKWVGKMMRREFEHGSLLLQFEPRRLATVIAR